MSRARRFMRPNKMACRRDKATAACGNEYGEVNEPILLPVAACDAYKPNDIIEDDRYKGSDKGIVGRSLGHSKDTQARRGPTWQPRSRMQQPSGFSSTLTSKTGHTSKDMKLRRCA